VTQSTTHTQQRAVGRGRIAIFVALVVVCAVAGTAIVLRSRADDPTKGTCEARNVTLSSAKFTALMAEPHVVFKSTDTCPTNGDVEVVPTSKPDGPRAIAPIKCDRVAAVATGGVCLRIDNSSFFAKYSGAIFDHNFQVTHTFPLPGLPSRARMSPDGHWAAMTVFVHGDSYSSAAFSTRTMFVDTNTGFATEDLEKFRVTDNGKDVKSVNRNYWGVTFTDDSDHFYATLGRNNDIQLIEGSVSSRSAHTVRSGIECPSLSPDQTHLAYKSRVGGTLTAVKWRLHVLDLRTGHDVALAETRSVDDQVEWLDDNTVLYAILRSPVGTAVFDTYRVPADGSGHPELYLKSAWSPSVGG